MDAVVPPAMSAAAAGRTLPSAVIGGVGDGGPALRSAEDQVAGPPLRDGNNVLASESDRGSRPGEIGGILCFETPRDTGSGGEGHVRARGHGVGSGRHAGQRNLGDGAGLGRDHPAAGQGFLAVPPVQLDLDDRVGRPGHRDLQCRPGIPETGFPREAGQPGRVLDVDAGDHLAEGRSGGRGDELDTAGGETPQHALLDDRGDGPAGAPHPDAEPLLPRGEPGQDDRAGGARRHQEPAAARGLDLALGAEEFQADRGRLPDALLRFRTAVRPSAVFAPTSQRSLAGCWQLRRPNRGDPRLRPRSA